jgi:hypothetical protein
VSPERRLSAVWSEWNVPPRVPKSHLQALVWHADHRGVANFCRDLGERLWRLEHPSQGSYWKFGKESTWGTKPRRVRRDEHS